jgi:osmotically-inducible protein OsmY
MSKMSVSIRSGTVESLEDQIMRLVQSRTGGRIDSLNVVVSGGEVIISGRTSTYYLKQLATHAALDLSGQFTGLTNEIAVS